MRTNKDRTQGVLLQGGIQPCCICKMNAADVALLSDFCAIHVFLEGSCRWRERWVTPLAPLPHPKTPSKVCHNKNKKV